MGTPQYQIPSREKSPFFAPAYIAMGILQSPTLKFAMAVIASALIFIATTHRVAAYSVSGNVYNTDGSIADINNAITAAPVGATVKIPPGNFTWGTGGSWVNLNNAVNLLGSGTGQTIITIDPTYYYTYAEVVRMSAPATVGNFSMIAANDYVGAFATNFSGSAASGFRITNVNYTDPSGAGVGYFADVEGNYGLIDNCTLSSSSGQCEWVFVRGGGNSWQTPPSLGGSNNVFIESCTFNGQAYVCDANANARVVVRYCTINGRQKIDGHGMASNSPARSVRHMEIYNNTWTTTSGAAQAIEVRGGSGYIFNNSQPSGTLWFWLNEYGCLAQWPNFGNTYQTPQNYPIQDQIGEGQDTLTNGLWLQAAGGSEPMYLWGNTNQGNNWLPGGSAIPAGANTLYQSQVHSASATFSLEGPPSPDIIQEGRDYYTQGGVTGSATFTGSDGVGVGTTAQMNAITSAKVGIGFWVTDQGSWNTNLPANTSGELFTWNGSSWVATYQPYQFPNPQITGAAVTVGGSTGTTSSGSGGWNYVSGAWVYQPYSSTPSSLPPAPTGLRVTGS
jgi:hypothetical protein